ncbi:DUF2087 domain-containing protein [Breznakiella homolactica]|uniref:DUF2087 domain-containing protein n=1 Tax=Breznakiella homolactica TaxID=2798577 RepID=A0A7T7XLF9_9SPIR|nr:DUF2087 domain-containing protein [Breznakiella homolactica]QQO08470.1 DUF2087 domain-containing protein [Breznakiella homolactica]
MKVDDLEIKDIGRGYTISEFPRESYRCAVCGKTFETGEVYGIGGRFFAASRAIEIHLETDHRDYQEQLIADDSRYNTLTENQKQLFRMFASGTSDKEIARTLGVAASTVRHQKFMFREKAKQAKLYLALYEYAFGKKTAGIQDIMPVHGHATMVDERYVVTGEERDTILHACFTSLDPLRLGKFPPKEKKKVVILTKIAEQFESGRMYSEKDVNRILEAVFDDYATIRRYLIDYGFMKRTPGGGEYWLTI